jgi:hypothetical protein
MILARIAMKRIAIFSLGLLAILLPISIAFAERSLSYPIAEQHSWGFIDKNGVFKIRPQFDSGNVFTNGFASVWADGNHHRYTIIDTAGKPITSELFHQAGKMFCGLAPITRDPKNDRDFSTASYISKNGTIWTSSFWQCGQFENGFSIAKRYFQEFAGTPNDDQSFIIDSKGKTIKKLDGTLWDLGFSEGLVPIRIGHQMGYADTKGDVIIKPRFRIARQFHEGLAAVNIQPKGTLRDGCGFINTRGEQVIPAIYSSAQDFHEGLARVESREFNKGGFIDQHGKMVIQLDSVISSGDFSEGLAAVRISSDETGFMDHSGKILFKVESNEVGEFHNGLCHASSFKSKDRLVGFVDKSGNWAIKPQFYKAMNFSEGLASVCVFDQKRLQEQRAKWKKEADEFRSRTWWQFWGSY